MQRAGCEAADGRGGGGCTRLLAGSLAGPDDESISSAGALVFSACVLSVRVQCVNDPSKQTVTRMDREEEASAVAKPEITSPSIARYPWATPISRAMLGPMRGCAMGWLAVVTICCGCGGKSRHGGADVDGGGPRPFTTGAGGTGGIPDAGFDALPDAEQDASRDVLSDYVDPGCPDMEPPPPEYECDPLADVSGCDPGFACYPWLDRPYGDGCDFEVFGSSCLPPGSGTQGQRCGNDYGWCAAQYICVVGASIGARCARLCNPSGPNTCPNGLICGLVDVEGFGVCG